MVAVMTEPAGSPADPTVADATALVVPVVVPLSFRMSTVQALPTLSLTLAVMPVDPE
jgi:hypothetical protein